MSPLLALAHTLTELSLSSEVVTSRGLANPLKTKRPLRRLDFALCVCVCVLHKLQREGADPLLTLAECSPAQSGVQMASGFGQVVEAVSLRVE